MSRPIISDVKTELSLPLCLQQIGKMDMQAHTTKGIKAQLVSPNEIYKLTYKAWMPAGFPGAFVPYYYHKLHTAVPVHSAISYQPSGCC